MNWNGHRKPTRSELLNSPDEFFHVFNRGVDRQQLFFGVEFYRLFLELMANFYNPLELQILAFCLMPNHFHLLVHQLKPLGISLLMEQLSSEFARTTNRFRGRIGHLFQRRYGLKWIWDEPTIPIVADYIHQNPIKANLVRLPEEWEFSSCREYFALRPAGFCTLAEVISRLDGSQDYRDHIRQISDAESMLDRRYRFPD